jgi:phage baseplate assembly protein W
MNETITLDGKAERIAISPASVAEEIAQNVRMILATPKYSVPLYRDFGVSWEYVDKPIDIAQSLLAGEITDAIQAYEPRCEVENITFERDGTSGSLMPKVEVRIIGS